MSAEDLKEIKYIRKKHGLNQSELAELAGVSQSMIAKIESGNLDPSYTKAQQIFAALRELENKKELKAEQVMKKHLISVKENEKITEVIKIMKQKSISQIPVMDKEKVLGIVTESGILKKIAEDPLKVIRLTVAEVMEDAPPIVTMQTSQQTLFHLLQERNVVLVADKGEIKGIISKSDLLGKI